MAKKTKVTVDDVAANDYSGRVVDEEKAKKAFPDLEVVFALLNRVSQQMEQLRSEIRALERTSRHRK